MSLAQPVLHRRGQFENDAGVIARRRASNPQLVLYQTDQADFVGTGEACRFVVYCVYVVGRIIRVLNITG